MAVYTRQSSSGIVDGGVIEAVDLNNEFDQIAAAYLAPTFGVGTAGTDIVLTFDGESADGVITWMEDEDYFKFSDDILLTTTEKLQFRDTALYIYSSTKFTSRLKLALCEKSASLHVYGFLQRDIWRIEISKKVRAGNIRGPSDQFLRILNIESILTPFL